MGLNTEESNKLADVSKRLTHLKKAVSLAEQNYKNWCQTNGENYHQSYVHSFGDTIQQAFVLSIPSATEKDAERLAEFTFFSHLIDDKVDPDQQFIHNYGKYCTNYRTFTEHVAPDVRKIADKMVSLASEIEGEDAAKRTIMKVMNGVLVQQSKTEEEQKKYARIFKDFVVKPIKNKELRKDLARLHPMQVYLTTHTALDGWFAFEGNHHHPDLDEIYSLFYAPMLYAHDREKETSANGEGFKVLFGKNLTKDEMIEDSHLIPLLKVFDRHITKMHDSKRFEHLHQMKAVYHTFETVLSLNLKSKYLDSISKVEQYLAQHGEKAMATVGQPRIRNKGLEKVLGFLGISAFALTTLLSPNILGNVISDNVSLSKFPLSISLFVVGLICILSLIILKRKVKRFRVAFFD